MVQGRMKSTPQLSPCRTGHMGSKEGFCCMLLAFLFCAHATETTEPVLTLASLQFSSIIPRRKAKKNKYLPFFSSPVLLFAAGRATVPHLSGQIELCIHAIQFCTLRGNRPCTPKNKIYICIYIRGSLFSCNANKNIFLHLFLWFISTLEF